MNYFTNTGLLLIIYLSSAIAQHQRPQHRPHQQGGQARPPSAPAPGAPPSYGQTKPGQRPQAPGQQPGSYQSQFGQRPGQGQRMPQQMPGQSPYGQHQQPYGAAAAGSIDQLQEEIYSVEQQLAVDEEKIDELQTELEGVPQEAGEALFAALQSHEEELEYHGSGVSIQAIVKYTDLLKFFFVIAVNLLIL